MFKRIDKDAQNHNSTPAKRPKLDVSKLRYDAKECKELINKGHAVNNDDIWGDDFAEDEIEQIDLVASQVCQQVSEEATRRTQSIYAPSTSKTSNNINNQHSRPSVSNPTQLSYIINAKEMIADDIKMTQDLNFETFQNKLLDKKYSNSTFHQSNDVILSDSAQSAELERLKNENKKLLNDFITKDGETLFLRNQLQQAQLRASNDRLEKTRSLEEQANRHRLEIDAICKEKENLQTQLNLKALELGTLLERCKLLESKNIKLIEPHIVTADSPSNRNRRSLGTVLSPAAKFSKVSCKENSVQTALYDQSSYRLKTCDAILDYPLARIPKLVFGIAPPEKSVVDIKIIEKTGKRNLPILQEEETIRIFENPDLVKPVVTMINNKRLTVEFVLSDLYVLGTKTSMEINSEDFIPTINKLVATTRELTLNTIAVLRTISQAMKSDDIRDMNDIYLSDAYNVCTKSFIAKSECDVDAWHDGECGIEARRMVGVLSIVTTASNYLSNYLAGKTQLLTHVDEAYNSYTQQMVRFNTWPKKNHGFECFEMILEFATLVGHVRRSHQFSGLISGIARLLCNLQESIALCDKGVDYVFHILRELVFARPLPLCYVSLMELMNAYVRHARFVRRLCTDTKGTKINVWKGALQFTPDACTLQILVAQMDNFNADPVMIVNITHPLISFVWVSLQTNEISLPRSESENSCNCCMKLLRFTIKMLSQCSEADLSETTNGKCPRQIYSQDISDDFWTEVERKQFNTIRAGIKFLCYLATCDPDFVIICDVEDAFYSFMQNINNFSGLTLHESDREALDLIKLSSVLERTVLSDNPSLPANPKKPSLHIKMNKEKRRMCPTPQIERTSHENQRKWRNSISMFKAVCRTKSNSND